MLGISTGTLDETDVNKSIKKISALNVSGIELMFLFEESFTKQKFTETSFELLKRFKFRTIHAPALYDYRKKEKLLEGLYGFYKKIKAEYIVFHAVEPGLLEPAMKFDWNICIENLPKRAHFTHEKIKNFLEKDVGGVLDVSHALEYSAKELVKLISLFKEKIRGIHLSYNKNGLAHQPLHFWKNEINNLEILKGFNCPIIIETNYKYGNVLKKELKFVKRFLNPELSHFADMNQAKTPGLH